MSDVLIVICDGTWQDSSSEKELTTQFYRKICKLKDNPDFEKRINVFKVGGPGSWENLLQCFPELSEQSSLFDGGDVNLDIVYLMLKAAIFGSGKINNVDRMEEVVIDFATNRKEATVVFVGFSRGSVQIIDLFQREKIETLRRCNPTLRFFVGLLDPVAGPEEVVKSVVLNVDRGFIVYALDEKKIGFAPLLISGKNIKVDALPGTHGHIGGSKESTKNKKFIENQLGFMLNKIGIPYEVSSQRYPATAIEKESGEYEPHKPLVSPMDSQHVFSKYFNPNPWANHCFPRLNPRMYHHYHSMKMLKFGVKATVALFAVNFFWQLNKNGNKKQMSR